MGCESHAFSGGPDPLAGWDGLDWVSIRFEWVVKTMPSQVDQIRWQVGMGWFGPLAGAHLCNLQPRAEPGSNIACHHHHPTTNVLIQADLYTNTNTNTNTNTKAGSNTQAGLHAITIIRLPMYLLRQIFALLSFSYLQL